MATRFSQIRDPDAPTPFEISGLIEHNHDIGGAASTYKASGLVVEASPHETSVSHHPIDPKNRVFTRLGVLDDVDWVPTGAIYEVGGGPVGEPFVLPEGFAPARHALLEGFPSAAAGISSMLGEIEHIATGLGTLSKGRQACRNPMEGLLALARLGPVVKGWRLSVAERFDRGSGDDEAVKRAFAATSPIISMIPARCDGSFSPSRKAGIWAPAVRLHQIQGNLTVLDWSILCAVAAGYDYMEIAAITALTASSLRTRVSRLRSSLLN